MNGISFSMDLKHKANLRIYIHNCVKREKRSGDKRREESMVYSHARSSNSIVLLAFWSNHIFPLHNARSTCDLYATT